MTSVPFLKPRFIGKRFEGGVIPLGVLGDFSALEALIVEVARWKFRSAHPDRTRVPKGFDRGVSLRLEGIEGGSAIADVRLHFSAGMLLPPATVGWFEEARDAVLAAIVAAEDGQAIEAHLPPPLLNYFAPFGRGLRDGESIEFPRSGSAPIRYDNGTRRRLVLASSLTEVTDSVTYYGLISAVDKRNNTFQVSKVDRTLLKKVPLPVPCRETVLEAFDGYENGTRIRLQGTARFDRQRQIAGFDTVDVRILEPLDIGYRFEELKLLKPGWLDGVHGLSLDPRGLDRLAEIFDERFPEDLPLPYFYPTAEGGVRAEWSLPPHEISLEIDLARLVGAWHTLNMQDDGEFAGKLDLADTHDADWLVEEIRRIAGTVA